MAVKTLSEQLLALLDADGQAKLKAVFAANPTLIAQDQKGTELVEVWSGFGGELEPPAAAVREPSTPHTPTLPSAAVTTPNSTPIAPIVANGNTGNGSADGLAKILAELESLKSQMAKDYVPVSKLGEYRTEILTHAIKTADDYSTIRENHRAEFSEPLDRNAFESFVATQNAAGVKFSSLASAHDTFVKDKRVTAATAAKKSEIDAAVAEALKQQRSSSSVPGQTQSTAMSAAQQVMAKAKASAKGGDAESAAMRVARQLEELDRNKASVQ